MMQAVSVCSEASSSISKTQISRQKNSSSQYTSKWLKTWQARKSSSVHWTSVQTNRLTISDLKRRQSGSRIPSDPYLSYKAGDLKTPAPRSLSCGVFGNISIMFPMIISVAEVRRIKRAIIAEVKEELKNEGIPYKEDVELGIMIETPASVMISRELAKEVDFFSVGTNDLTQYTLAIDRQNAKLDKFYDPHHPAVLAMIKMAADNAHAEGAWIGICGELGADLELTEEFLKMGLDELSVSPAMVLPLRKRIRECE